MPRAYVPRAPTRKRQQSRLWVAILAITRTEMKTEQEIFQDLEQLCTSPGYVHAIGYLCWRDSTVRYSEEMTAEDTAHLFSTKRLIRTEISTLTGLLIKKDIDFTIPAPDVTQHYLDDTEHLLEEMHRAMADAMFGGRDLKSLIEEKIEFNPFSTGEALREPIFYSGESAYSFQYRDFALGKYAADDEWLKANKGFGIQAAHHIVHAVQAVTADKLSETCGRIRQMPTDNWTLLPGFSFTTREISEHCGIAEDPVEKVLSAFTVPKEEHNENFRSLHDFNLSNALPLLRCGPDGFILFQQYALVEALYDSPFYWMTSDANYKNQAMIHRGRFTEEFSRERLERVFGNANTYANVSIYESPHQKAGEIDVLVLFGDRAIVLQAKSKRLTLEARRGNNRVIKEDFRKSVEESYDQANKCAKLLGNSRYKLLDSQSREIRIPKAPKEVYIICVVSDNYPALNFQAQQLLKFEPTPTILPPLVTDIFTLDALTEMLSSPLYLLSYLNRRAGYHDRLMARDELTILAHHLTKNLWLSEEYGFAVIDDSICADLDIAMAARRDKVPGKTTPEGILTRLRNTSVGRIILQLETENDPRVIDLGFMLLTLSEHAIMDISKAIETIGEKARNDRKNHDISVPLIEARAGLTIHYNDDSISRAATRLQGHCELRKYKEKANRWFGICLSTRDNAIRCGVNLDHPWVPNPILEAAVAKLRTGSPQKFDESSNRPKKPGRNAPCPCGSGKKYKRCCLK
jgi:hypothetical protein